MDDFTNVTAVVLGFIGFVVLYYACARMRSDRESVDRIVTELRAPIDVATLPRSVTEILERDAMRFGDSQWFSDRGAEAVSETIGVNATTHIFWDFGAYYTGIALLATFALIGFAMIRIQFNASEDLLKQSIDTASKTIAFKFFLSAAGLFLSMFHAYRRSEELKRIDCARKKIARSLRGCIVTTPDTHSELLLSRLDSIERSSREGSHRIAEVGSRTNELLQALESGRIESANATHAMVNAFRGEFATHHITSLGRAGELLAQQVETVRKIEVLGGKASTLVELGSDGLSSINEHVTTIREQVTGPGIDCALAMLREVLGSELKDKLEPLLVDIRSQRNEELLNDLSQRLHAAITGGASDVTREFNASLERVARIVPEILERVERSAGSLQIGTSAAFDELKKRMAEDLEAAASLQSDLHEQLSKTLTESVDSFRAHTKEVVDSSREIATKLLGDLNEVTRTSLGDQRALVAHADEARRAEFDAHSNVSVELLSQMGVHVEQLRETKAHAGALADQAASQRAAVEGLFKSIDGSANAVHERHKTVLATTESLRVHLERLVGVMSDQATRVEQGFKQTEQAVVYSERVESTLKSIVKDVRTVLKEDLERVQRQVQEEQQLIDKLLQSVDKSIVANLSSTVGDLTSAVKELKVVVAGYRTAVGASHEVKA